MGQALCKRTLNIVEKLNEKHGDRLRFYLSKADEAGGESDRQVHTHAHDSVRARFFWSLDLKGN
jgi:uncharacterized protein YmfQ (DUF2313 family)